MKILLFFGSFSAEKTKCPRVVFFFYPLFDTTNDTSILESTVNSRYVRQTKKKKYLVLIGKGWKECNFSKDYRARCTIVSIRSVTHNRRKTKFRRVHLPVALRGKSQCESSAFVRHKQEDGTFE